MKNKELYPEFTLIIVPAADDRETGDKIRRFFYDAYADAVSHKTDLFIITREHDLCENHYVDCALAVRPDNVLIYGLENDVYFHGIENLNQLIDISSAVVRMEIQTVAWTPSEA
ncbi:hypothetical protein [Erwinia mallotivora]|uniref:Uncharacterized protein n=1 Tax=Erwinia mallotivora TaxID=69222 RepID=A0A014N2P7_9GAMM|nr:hypothetical protein [Erwinia mallotivora]EXU73653.1 hypothetical protein BG55_22485 [Erwinia mallotivora]